MERAKEQEAMVETLVTTLNQSVVEQRRREGGKTPPSMAGETPVVTWWR